MLGERQGPVREPLKRATDGRQAAIAEWIKEVREVVPDARQQAEEVIEEKSTDYTRKEEDFFMQEFGAWSQQLDKLLVAGAAAGYVGQAAYKKESGELRETQHRMRQAQEWLSMVKSTLPEEAAEITEVRQEAPPKQIITPPTDFSREMAGLSLGTERPAGSAPTAMEISMAQMLAG
jgi:hypothetical protein